MQGSTSRGIWVALILIGATVPSGCDDPVDVGGDGGASSTSTGAGGAGGDATTTTTTTGTGGSGGAPCVDADGDGVGSCDGDCDDGDPNVLPGHPEICGDGRDNDCASGVDDTCGGLGTFVSPNGDDTNPGTQAEPLATIGKGIENAQAIGNGVDVYVAAGSYPETLTIVEGVSLLGGYHEAPDGWTRDVVANTTTIACSDFVCVTIPSTVTRDTAVDGFTIEGMGGDPSVGPGSVAVLIDRGSPTLSHDVVYGGQVTGGLGPAAIVSTAVRIVAPIASPGPLIAGNEIDGGPSVGTSNGIVFAAADYPASELAVAEIVHNTIVAGEAPTSLGVNAWASAAGTVLRDNDIGAGHSQGGESWGVALETEVLLDKNRIGIDPNIAGWCEFPMSWCGGVVVRGAAATITNNVIGGGKSNQNAGILLVARSLTPPVVTINGNYLAGGKKSGGFILTHSAAIVVRNEYGSGGTALGRIRNNILDGGHCDKRYGVWEDDDFAAPDAFAHFEALTNNDVYFPPPNEGNDFIARTYDGAPLSEQEITSMALVNGLLGAELNFAGAPDLDLAYHLNPGSPCVDKGTATEAPVDDMDGESRPEGAGIDVGPDEAM